MTHEENGWIRRAGRPVSFDGGCAYRGDHFDPDARIAAVSVVFVGNGCTKKRKERGNENVTETLRRKERQDRIHSGYDYTVWLDLG